MHAIDLEKYLVEHIPISSAMGVKVDVISAEKIILRAPLLNNINHKKTAFGGSLHAVATLACWSFLHVKLIELFQDPAQIVIASSEINYLFPVTSDFKAECNQPEFSDWERFLKMLRQKGKGRLQLKARIVEKEQVCVSYSGVFVTTNTLLH